MYVRLLENEIGPGVDPDLRDGLAAARDEMTRLDRLLGHLVEFHRSGTLTIAPTLIDAGVLIGDTVRRMLRTLAPDDGDVEVRSQELIDWWDPSAVEQIVQQLVLNSIQHGGRPISVVVDRIDRRMGIRVHDGGSRIPARVRQRMFRRRPNIPRVRATGLGIGLWLVRELAEAHGGSVAVETPKKGGTTFVVILNPLPPAPVTRG
jgi:signal transduction histidine kinase